MGNYFSNSSILVAGGMQVSRPEKADFVLLVNTNQDGRTADSNTLSRAGGQIVINREYQRWRRKSRSRIFQASG